jgi:hypothetical protein
MAQMWMNIEIWTLDDQVCLVPISCLFRHVSHHISNRQIFIGSVAAGNKTWQLKILYKCFIFSLPILDTLQKIKFFAG